MFAANNYIGVLLLVFGSIQIISTHVGQKVVFFRMESFVQLTAYL